MPSQRDREVDHVHDDEHLGGLLGVLEGRSDEELEGVVPLDLLVALYERLDRALDLELGVEDVIKLVRNLLGHVFDQDPFALLDRVLELGAEFRVINLQTTKFFFMTSEPIIMMKLFACSCGSIHSDQRLEFIMIIVFSMLNSSSGSLYSAFQFSISTLLPMIERRDGLSIKLKDCCTRSIQVLNRRAR